jgi:hypothetical protein
MTYQLYKPALPFKDYKQNRGYIGNKMTGVPYFNTPWFDQAAAALLALPAVEEVFNPAEHDRQMGFDPMKCPNGSAEESRAAGFIVRDALAADYSWICKYSDFLVIGPDWLSSPGTVSEIAIHQALRLPVWEYAIFLAYWDQDHLYDLALPPIMGLGGRTKIDGRYVN